MAKTTKEVKELLKKLQVLAERGIGGEKEGARRKLEQLLKANNMIEEDLLKDDLQYYLLSYSGQAKKRLLLQCIYKTLGANNTTIYKSRNTRNKIGIWCTTSQKIEIDLDFEFYSALLDDEIDSLVTAFIAKQDIFPDDAPCTTIDASSLSKDELDKWNKIDAYKRNMQKQKRASNFIEDKHTN